MRTAIQSAVLKNMLKPGVTAPRKGKKPSKEEKEPEGGKYNAEGEDSLTSNIPSKASEGEEDFDAEDSKDEMSDYKKFKRRKK